MLTRLISLPRPVKRAIAVATDITVLFMAYLMALAIHWESVDWEMSNQLLFPIVLAMPISVGIFYLLGLYRAIIRFMSLSALLVILFGVITSAAVLGVVVFVLQVDLPESVLINYALVSLVMIGGLRIGLRAVFEKQISKEKHSVIIYGAGSAGRQLAQALINGAEYHPACFVDDDITLQGSTILGRRVYPRQLLPDLIRDVKPHSVLLALPSIARSRRKEILDVLEPLKITVQSIPGMADMVDGRAGIDQLEDVRVEDLLGRDPVPPQKALMDVNIKARNVLVTGAGGSIGAELCRQIIQYEPTQLILLESSEYNLYAIERELRQLCSQKSLLVKVKPILCSIQNRSRVLKVMQMFRIDTVYHAAAFKHVPMVEYNIAEGVRNNVFGTVNVAEAAIAAQVSSFVLISTDKAVRPTNVMGASKRMAELVLQGLANRDGHSTCFSMVRFGNVLGSSGSVVPLFRQQILDGGPVTVTHPEITRYFMTIPEAAQLVIQAGAMGTIRCNECSDTGGDVFVLDMGEPVKIADLARKLIHLMGLSVRSEGPHCPGRERDIEVVFSGLRPGEKLYEELLIGDDVQPTGHPRIMTASETSLGWTQVEQLLNELDRLCKSDSVEEIYNLLRLAPLGFEPSSGICDVSFVQKQ